METFSLILPRSTVELLHLVARRSDRTVGQIVQEMTLERYMSEVLGALDPPVEGAWDRPGGGSLTA